MSAQEHQQARLYEINPSPAKGLGVFATTDISNGTRVTSEKPLIKLKGVGLSLPHVLSVWTQLHALSPMERQAFYSLSNNPSQQNQNLFRAVKQGVLGEAARQIPDKAPQAFSIVITNGFGLSKSGAPEEGVMGLVLEGSRFNHSCHPNVHWTYNARTDKVNFHMIRDVVAGAEPLIAYCDIQTLYEQRHHKLDKVWGFECYCTRCMAVKEKTVLGTRFEAGTMFRDKITMIDKKDVESGIEVAKQIAILQYEMGIVTPLQQTYHELMRLNYLRSMVSPHQTFDTALYWAIMRMLLHLWADGVDSEGYTEVEQIVRHLRQVPQGKAKLEAPLTLRFIDDEGQGEANEPDETGIPGKWKGVKLGDL